VRVVDGDTIRVRIGGAEEPVRRGYATVATFPPNVRHTALFHRLADRARMSDRGLWRRCVGAQ
jgi:endonuclease YncB( thermonuclease family)